MLKRFLILVAFVAWASPVLAQNPAVIVLEGPITPVANCTVQRNAGNTAWSCTAPSAASQPLTDGSGLIADNADPTKVLFFQLSGIATATNRTWTIPNADITFPTTIASLAANTFTGLQTLNAGLAATTGTFSSTLGVTGATTLSSTINVAGLVTAAAGIRVTGTAVGTGTMRMESNAMNFQGGSNGYGWVDSSNAAFRMQLSDAGVLTLLTPNTHPLRIFPSTTTSYATIQFSNNGDDGYVGANGSGATTFFTAGTAYALLMRSAAGTPIEFGISSAKYMTLSPTGSLKVIGVGVNGYDAIEAPQGFVAGSAGVYNGALSSPESLWFSIDADNNATDREFIIQKNVYGPSGGTSIFRINEAGALRLHLYGAGTLVTDGDGNVTASSDERLKNITGQFRVGLNAIMGLRPILHRWKPETGYDTENVYASWSAQNVLQFVPEAVGIGLDGKYTVNDRPIMLAMANAIQELAAEVDELRKVSKLPVMNRTMQPVNGDDMVIKSATKTRLAEIAKADEDRKFSEQRTRLTACDADNAIIVAQGGKAETCEKSDADRTERKAMNDERAKLAKEEDAKLARELEYCVSLNTKIVASGGVARDCGSPAVISKKEKVQ
jgi:hypothetical protein